MFESVDAVAEGLRAQGYLTGRDVATQVYLASRLGKPLLVEGPPGSGRSALARSVAAAGGVPFFEVACSPQITADDATHRWDVDRQLLHLREAAAAGRNMEHPRAEAFSETFLIPGPVISAFRESGPSVLLFRDIALAPAPFLLWLGRVLDDSAVDVPALGRISAPVRPVVFLTANADRPISPEIAHRCLAISLSYPPFEAEVEILLRHVKGLSRPLAAQVTNFLGRLRQQPLTIAPGLSESLDWSRALVALRAGGLSPQLVDQTLGCILKDARDLDTFRGRKLGSLLGGAMDRLG